MGMLHMATVPVLARTFKPFPCRPSDVHINKMETSQYMHIPLKGTQYIGDGLH